MKKILLYTVFLFVSVASVRAAEPTSQERWALGNKAYAAGDYAEAVKEYKAIVDGGEYSFELYYNLGNAYYKADSVGKAILYYNKALRVDPSQEDARHNLTLAEKRITDNVAEESEFFLAKWMRGLRNTMSCTAWSVLSLVSFASLLTFALLFLLASRISLRKTGFYCALVALLLFVATISFAISSRNDMLTHDQAIILSSSISTKSSPDRSATELFVLHEGTKVRVVSEHNGWSEVVLADGKKGWIENIHIERI
jgi:tetratricopeptide (TPR) repeat protein